MNHNLFFKILSSLPVIFLALYFIPFLGVCLILLRYLIYEYQKRISTPIIIVSVGIFLLIPKVIYFVLDVLGIDISTISYLNDVVNTSLYDSFINYSKLLICLGVILLIVSLFCRNIFSRLCAGVKNYIIETENKDAEISNKNDMEIKLKQERAKNTNFFKCPNCGADNIVSKKIGTCKYCRRKFENDKYKS